MNSTTSIIQNAEYFDSPQTFFSNFKEAWKNTQNKVYKIETRQIYQEPWNVSYDYLVESGWDLFWARERIKEARKMDVSLYKSLIERNIDFIRCRPILQPLSLYLQREMFCYEFNSKHGEKIFFVEYEKAKDLLKNFFHHDYMVFDKTVAFIHNYNKEWLIQGGWVVTQKKDIKTLSNKFENFLKHAKNWKSFNAFISDTWTKENQNNIPE